MKNSFRPRLQTLVSGWVLIFAAVVVFPALADTRTVEFKNTTGGNVDDLHIIWNNATATAAAAPFPSERVSADQKIHNHWGATVANNAKAAVQVGTANGVNATIKDWWWTVGGNATADGTATGGVQIDDGGSVLTAAGGLASGNGTLKVEVGAASCTYALVAGQSPSQTVDALVAFINTNASCQIAFQAPIGNQPFAYAVKFNPTTLCIFSNVNDTTVIVTIPVADTTQVLIPSESTKVPALTTVGFAVLIALLVVSSAVMLRRRSNASA